MSAGAEKFVDTILQLYPPFRWDEEQETRWMEIMARELGGFSDKVLENALAQIVRSRKDHRTPTVAECVGACLESRRFFGAKDASETLPAMRAPNPNYYSEEREQLADDLMKCELGRQACHEGWQLAMWNFCRDNMRHPHGHEIERCKRDARGFDQTYDEVRRASENVGHMRNPILDFARNMLAEREKIKAEVLGP